MKVEGRVIPLTVEDIHKGKNIHDVAIYIDGAEIARYDGLVTKTTLKLSGFAATDEAETVHYCMQDFIDSKGWIKPQQSGIKLVTYIWEVEVKK